VCPYLKEYGVERTSQRRVEVWWRNFINHFNLYTLTLLMNLNKFLFDSLGSMSSIVDNNLHLTSGGSSSSGESHIVYMTNEAFG
jgi:hypothetical protein